MRKRKLYVHERLPFAPSPRATVAGRYPQGPLSPKGNNKLNVCCLVCSKAFNPNPSPRTLVCYFPLGIADLGDSGPTPVLQVGV